MKFFLAQHLSKQKLLKFLLIALLFSVSCIAIKVCISFLNLKILITDEGYPIMDSFYFIGRQPLISTPYCLNNGFPVFMNSYISALKAILYGLYLKLFSCDFSVFSVRFFGFAMYISGFIIFLVTCIKRKVFSKIFLIIFTIFFLSDINTLLCCLYDYGPSAISFFLRMIFVTIWVLFIKRKGNISKTQTFFIGLLVGLSLYEKLSNISLLIPLIQMILMMFKTKKNKHILYCIFGVFIGFFPWIGFSIYYYLASSHILIFDTYNLIHNYAAWNVNLIRFFYLLLGLGSGVMDITYTFFLESKLLTPTITLEIIFNSFLIILSTIYFIQKKNIKNKILFRNAYLIYILTALAFIIILKPNEIGTHHLINTVPFNYIFLTLFLENIITNSKKRKLFKIIIIIIFILLIVFRCGRLLRLDQTIRQWNTIDEIKLSKLIVLNQDALFYFSDQEMAMRMVCYTNGAINISELKNSEASDEELITNFNSNIDNSLDYLKIKTNTIYVILNQAADKRARSKTKITGEKINRYINDSAKWHKLAINKDFKNISEVKINKYFVNKD